LLEEPWKKRVGRFLREGRTLCQWRPYAERLERRAQRYAEILERLVSPEGYLPALGRSCSYRFGILQLPAQLALEGCLPSNLAPEQLRSASTAVMARMDGSPGMYDAQGFLNIGMYGNQPALGEAYICTGSLYLCCTGLLALGLPP